MAISFRIDSDQTIYVTYSGTVTKDDSLALLQTVPRDPLFRRDARVLVDMRDVTDLKWSTDDVYALAQRTVLGPGARRAIVASRGRVYGMARMYEILSEHRPDETAVFRTIVEARN